MKKALLIVLVGGMATLSFAQESKPLGLSARVGLFFPSAEKARNAGKQWLGFGLDYKLGDLKFAKNNADSQAHYGLSVDFLSKNGLRSTPLTLNYVSTTPGHEGTYYFGGVGVNFAEEKDNSNNKVNKTGLAFQFGAGMDIKGQKLPAFAQLKWMGGSRTLFNGFKIDIGVRF